MTIRKQTFSGVRWATFSTIGRAILQFVQIAILSRLLSPADFGLVALVISIMAFLQIFADAGISNAIIHYQIITRKQLSSLYWLNVLVSTVLALVLTGSSYFIALWYQQTELQYLLIFAGITLVASSFGQQFRVLAQKQFRFAELAKIEMTSAMLSFFVALGLAYSGAGVYSLIIGSLTAAIAGTLLVWKRLSVGYRPQLRFYFIEIRKFINFGAYMVGNNLANTFNSQVDILLGMKLLGPHALGIYSMPKELNLRIAGFINPIVTQVGLPLMAKAHEDKVLLKTIYLQTMRMTASVNFPIYIFIGLFAQELILLLLGDQWNDAIPLLQIFAIWALVRSTGNPVGSLLMACGRADLSFKWNLVWLCIMPPTIWFGSQFGISGMAISMAILSISAYLPNWYFQVRPLCGAGLKEYSIQLFIPLLLSIFAGAFGFFSVNFLHDDITRLSIGATTFVLIYLGLSWKFNRMWANAMVELIAFKRA